MLPWRRSKFVLVENERKCKGKSLGPGLGYASLLAGFLRSCPDLLPECPLERLGSVFGGRRQKVELNKEDPTYTVRYLGNAVTLHAKGEGCTEEAVGKIWAKSDAGAGGAKMKLTLGPHGIRMAPGEKGARRSGHAYLLHRITYCTADRRHPKVFAWVYRHQVKNKAVVLRCHAVLVPKAATARAMALLLFQTSASAFDEFKRLKRQNDGRRLQQQLLGEAIVPLMPLRRLLNAKCPYRPPGEQGAPLPHSLRKGMHHWEGVWVSSPHIQQPGRGRAVVLIPSLNFGGWHLVPPTQGSMGLGIEITAPQKHYGVKIWANTPKNKPVELRYNLHPAESWGERLGFGLNIS
uniref:Family with sequence similarity 43 member B n=1 Tax=Phasianus colchicus TaxID=9054 RepID=A0A669QTL6_PHACC